VPQTWGTRQAGDTTLRAQLKVEINPAVTDQSFDVAAEGYTRVAALPDNLDEKIEQLADGVFVIQNVAGQNLNTLAVAFKDYIVAVEAPGSSAGADEVIKRIKAAIPGKPIRYVAMTHHHSDHIGGLRSFIAEGATVITTQSNREVVEAMAAAPQLDRLAQNPRKPDFLFIERGKRVLTDGARTLQLIDVGPNPHAREMVIAYLPKERVLFQGDLFFLPANDAPTGPPQPTTVSFAQKLQDLKLGVDRIASVHGRTTTIDEFQRAMRSAVPST
jgi:glyoxylase-like metal-dependent hydrolase (beta-lactamase superfamily II)